MNIPHVAGQAWKTQVTVTNAGPDPYTFAFKAFDEQGVISGAVQEREILPFQILELDNQDLGFGGVAQITHACGAPLAMGVTYQFGDSESACAFHLDAQTEGRSWVLPIPHQDWIGWQGMAISQFGDQECQVTVEAYVLGGLAASHSLTLQPMQKQVGLLQDWLGLSPDAAGVDMILVTADTPIPAPIFIAGKADQSRHIFFPGFAVLSP